MNQLLQLIFIDHHYCLLLILYGKLSDGSLDIISENSMMENEERMEGWWKKLDEPFKSKRTERIVTVVMWVMIVLASLPLLHFGRRVFITDRFVVRGVSMTPTLTTGQGVYVRKWLMGPRIYTSFDFGEGKPLQCRRLPGIRRIRAGDIAVFNSPEGFGVYDRITFKLNYVYAKRCLGAAGDTIGIKDSHYYSSGAESTGIPESQEQMLRSTPDSVFQKSWSLAAGQFAGEADNWTIKDLGPIVVPYKGMTIAMDSVNTAHYARVIDYELGVRPIWSGGRALLEGVPLRSYVFRENYCFFVGDNAPNSRDSRYFGFVPEKFVIGIFKVPRTDLLLSHQTSRTILTSIKTE